MNSIRAESANVATAAPAAYVPEPKFAAGMAALEKGDQTKAEAEFKARLTTNPTDPDAEITRLRELVPLNQEIGR